MIELKWIRTGCTMELFYRVAISVDASGALCPGEPSEWRKVLVEDAPENTPDTEAVVMPNPADLDTPNPE